MTTKIRLTDPVIHLHITRTQETEMCTYTTHVRACCTCGCEETVLISEQLCPVARASGIFGSCLEGIRSERDATVYQCWQCKERSPAGFGGRTAAASRGKRMRRASVKGWS
ncbi:hypothetical protein VTK56DRAFT_4726 [Thermocarpiscus australiensis]